MVGAVRDGLLACCLCLVSCWLPRVGITPIYRTTAHETVPMASVPPTSQRTMLLVVCISSQFFGLSYVFYSNGERTFTRHEQGQCILLSFDFMIGLGLDVLAASIGEEQTLKNLVLCTSAKAPLILWSSLCCFHALCRAWSF